MLEVVALLGDSVFAESGRPIVVRWSRDHRLLAVASTFEPIQWDGRHIDRPAVRHRVALYDGSTLHCLGVLDRAWRSINDMDFHPTRPLLAVASGEYDGGFFYEGDLFLWDFEKGEAASVLSENREVVSCSFNPAGDRLRLELRPPTDEDETEFQSLLLETEVAGDSWPIEDRGIDVDTLSFTPTESQPSNDDGPAPIVEELSEIARSRGGSYEPRWLTWDVAWWDGDLIACRPGVPLERWSLSGERRLYVEDGGVGVQVLAARDVAYVNVFLLRWEEATGWVRHGWIERVDPQSGERARLSGIDGPSVISIARTGHLLVRDADLERVSGRTQDRLVSPDGTVSEALDLGRYDLFNHYLPIDDGPALYFLQGTPPASHEEKWICAVSPESRAVARLFPLEWSGDRGAHLFGKGGCHVEDDLGSALIIGSAIYDPSGTRLWLLTRRDLPDGRARWEQSFESDLTAIEYVAAAEVILFSLSSGELGVVDAKTGETRSLGSALSRPGGAVVTNASVHGRRVAVGTIDGRIVVYEFLA